MQDHHSGPAHGSRIRRAKHHRVRIGSRACTCRRPVRSDVAAEHGRSGVVGEAFPECWRIAMGTGAVRPGRRQHPPTAQIGNANPVQRAVPVGIETFRILPIAPLQLRTKSSPGDVATISNDRGTELTNPANKFAQYVKFGLWWLLPACLHQADLAHRDVPGAWATRVNEADPSALQGHRTGPRRREGISPQQGSPP